MATDTSATPGASSSSLSLSPPSSTSPYPFPPGSVFTDGHPLPRLFVFDLDYTLWPFWVDTHVTSPIKVVKGEAGAEVAASDGKRRGKKAKAAAAQKATGGDADFHPVSVVDRYGETFAFYRDVPHVLQALPAAGLSMGVASRTSAPDMAQEMLQLLRVPTLKPRAERDEETIETNGTKGTTPSSRVAVTVFDAGLEMYPTTKLRHMEALHTRTGIPYADFLFFDDESRNRNVETLGVTMFLVRDGVTWDAVERGVRAWRRRHGHSGGGRDKASKGVGKGSKKSEVFAQDSGDDDDGDYEYAY